MNNYSLTKADLEPSSQHTDLDKIKAEVLGRKHYTIEYGQVMGPQPPPAILDPKQYSLDGSLIASIDEFNKSAPEYFKRSRRTIIYRNRVHLRGGRYIISSNPTFELRQKLITFKEDLYEGFDAMQNCENPFYQLAIADYMKNSVITMLNSFLTGEKIGRYKLGQHTYQSLRQEAQKYGQAAVDFFYGALFQNPNLSQCGFNLLDNNRNTFEKIQKYILKEYQRGTFSSRHITRPEASHPLVIASAVAMCSSSDANNYDTILGLPSGSTELAFAHAVGQTIVNNRRCEVLLFPVSLHSVKIDFDTYQVNPSTLARWTKHNSQNLTGKNILIVDDNCSTGKTIKLVAESILAEQPNTIEVAIAEADLVRSELDLSNKNRESISDVSNYKLSVNVLPVSRSLIPKTDMKEILERRKMIACTKTRLGTNKSDLSAWLLAEVYTEMLQLRSEEFAQKKDPSKTIHNFRKTFLSNFYPVEIFYSGKNFKSVEHAFQAMKFEQGTWEKITKKDMDYINRQLRKRNAHITIEQLPDMFVLPEVTAGTSKIAANCMRVRGYVRPDWDDVKASIMTELLIQKFAKSQLWKKLADTENHLLIEGNDWDDTYWGECNGRGRNVLGRLLMAIRSMKFEDITAEAGRLSEKH